MNIILYWTILISILLIVVAVWLSEAYKIRFECSKEAKDERGMLILLKQKTLSYHILFLGICASFAIIIPFNIVPRDFFLYAVMIVVFTQSIVSAFYTRYLRQTI